MTEKAKPLTEKEVVKILKDFYSIVNRVNALHQSYKRDWQEHPRHDVKFINLLHEALFPVYSLIEKTFADGNTELWKAAGVKRE